jgi:hypothetical protein
MSNANNEGFFKYIIITNDVGLINFTPKNLIECKKQSLYIQLPYNLFLAMTFVVWLKKRFIKRYFIQVII